MATRIRFAVAALLVLSLAGLIALGRWPVKDSLPSTNGVAALTNTDCRRCHVEVWNEWHASYHRQAWSDEFVQAAFQHFGFDRQCQKCHAPEPIFTRGVQADIVLRADDLASGVNCLSCHALPGGAGVAAMRTVADAPCRPQARSELAGSEACAKCHTAIYADWNASRYRAEGKTCQACHMPPLEGSPQRKSHHCLGGHDEQLVKSGARMQCRVERDELLVEVTNHATGHNFPGERHNRVLLLEVFQYDTEGAVTLAQQELIKGITPFRGESSAEKIRVDETFAARFPIAATGKANVRLLYKPFPWYADRDALVVHEEKIELPAGAR